MMTLRQIERFFDDHQFRRLYRELVAARPEANFALEATLARVVPVAALAVIRLDELSQSHTPLYRRFLNVVLTSQQLDGGWTDPMTTALCVRALLAGNGSGESAARGLAYLANLQKTEGAWPREPIRRMPADAVSSAFILFQLADRESFRRAVRFYDAVDWFAHHAKTLDGDARRMWAHAAARCRVPAEPTMPPSHHLWSPARPAA